MSNEAPNFWEALAALTGLALFVLNAMLWWVTRSAASAAEKSANAAHRQANIASENLELLRQQIKPTLVVETATPRLRRDQLPEVVLSVSNAGATMAAGVVIAGDVYFAPPGDRAARRLTEYPSVVNIAPGQQLAVTIGGEDAYDGNLIDAYMQGNVHLYATGALTYLGPDGRQNRLLFKFHGTRPERRTLALSHDGNEVA